MASFRIIPFDTTSLEKIVKEKSHDQLRSAGPNGHLPYFNDYLKAIGTVTVVVEEEYIDHDFLEDFSAYYVRCFTAYQKTCSRLHFFSHEFDEGYFSKILKGEIKPNSLQNNYLGFVVVKPLPNTVIGRTCLVNYPSNGNRDRKFPVLNEIVAHLFGIRLTVMSQPFQEQDTEVAACASSALWSVFHGTGRLFQHSIPSPVESLRTTNRRVAPATIGPSASDSVAGNSTICDMTC